MVILVEEQVLGLEIAVHDAVAVDVLDTRKQLLEVSRRGRFLEALVPDDFVEELAVGSVLHDQVDGGGGLNDLRG